MWRYYELCTDLSLDGIAEMKKLVKDGTLHPKKAKEGLAMRIVADFQGEDGAREAMAEFRRVFEQRGTPDEVPEHSVPAGDGRVPLAKLLVEIDLASSNSEATRLIRQGGVRLDDSKVPPDTREIDAKAGESRLVKVGKRRFARVIFS
jgi:tyrosyl-tRNA synthetase